MIVLFTTSYRALYKRDVLNLCCFEHGAMVRFGYRGKFVAENLRPNRGARMKNQQAVVVFCDWQGQRDGQVIYYPLRLVHIVDVDEDVFGSFALTLELEDLFDYQGGGINNYIDELQRTVSEFESRPNTTKSERQSERDRRYVSDEGDWPLDRFNGEWGTLASRIGKCYDFRESTFFRILAPPMTTSPFPGAEWERRACRASYSLSADKRYELHLRLLPGSGNVFRKPECVLEGDVASVLGPFLKQSTEGIDADFLITTKRLFKDELSTLVVRVNPDREGEVLSPELHGVVTIDASKKILWAAIVCLVLGGFLQALGLDLKDATLAWVVAKLSGSLLMAFGAYLGFNKLPFKGR